MKAGLAVSLVLLVVVSGTQAQRVAEYLDFSVYQALVPSSAPGAPAGAPLSAPAPISAPSGAPQAAAAPVPVTAPQAAPAVAPAPVPAPTPVLPPVLPPVVASPPPIVLASPPPAVLPSPPPVVVASPPPAAVSSPPPPATTGTATNYPFSFIPENKPGLPGRKLMAGVAVTTSNTVTFTTYILPGTSSPPLTDPTSAPTYSGAQPTGTITITDEGGAVVATTAVTSGQAISFATLSNGLHKLTTQYTGDSTYAASKTSVPYSVLVQGTSGGGGGITIG